MLNRLSAFYPIGFLIHSKYSLDRHDGNLEAAKHANKFDINFEFCSPQELQNRLDYDANITVAVLHYNFRQKVCFNCTVYRIFITLAEMCRSV